MLGSEQIKNLVIAMGTSIGDTFDIEKMRYHKIIIATDADVDGAHIRTLILTLMYRYFRAVIDAGYIYIAQPPLFKIKKGKEVMYAYSDEERDSLLGKDAPSIEELLKESAEEGDVVEVEVEVEEENETSKSKKATKIHVQRYKGLGEMNADELWETTMDPKTRILKQVTVTDALDANQIFDMLMGSEVPPRKAFIQSHAKMAKLDI
jgi:DNA gyrase subunit B